MNSESPNPFVGSINPATHLFCVAAVGQTLGRSCHTHLSLVLGLSAILRVFGLLRSENVAILLILT